MFLFLLSEWSTYYDQTIQPTNYSNTNYTTDPLIVSGNNVYITNCLFQGLTSESDGGAINWEDLANECKLLIENSIFNGCSANSGGGLNIYLSEGEIVYDKVAAMQCLATGTDAYGLFSKSIVKDSGTAKHQFNNLLVTDIDGEENLNACPIIYSAYGYIIYTNSNISGNAGKPMPLLINALGSYDSSNSDEYDMILSYMTVTKNVASYGNSLITLDFYDSDYDTVIYLDSLCISDNLNTGEIYVLLLQKKAIISNCYVNENTGDASIRAAFDALIIDSILRTDCMYCTNGISSYSPADSVNSDFQKNHLSLEDYYEFIIPQADIEESSIEPEISSEDDLESSLSDKPDIPQNNDSNNPKDAPDAGSKNIGAIAGSVVGGLSLLAIIVIIIICILKNGGLDYCKGKVEDMINEEEEEEEDDDDEENEKEHKNKHHHQNKDHQLDHQQKQTNDQVDTAEINETNDNEHSNDENLDDQLQHEEL